MNEMEEFVVRNFYKTVNAVRTFYSDGEWRYLVKDREEMFGVTATFMYTVFNTVYDCKVDGKTCCEMATENFELYVATYDKYAPEARKTIMERDGTDIYRLKEEGKLDETYGAALCWGALMFYVHAAFDNWYASGCPVKKPQDSGYYKD